MKNKVLIIIAFIIAIMLSINIGSLPEANISTMAFFMVSLPFVFLDIILGMFIKKPNKFCKNIIDYLYNDLTIYQDMYSFVQNILLDPLMFLSYIILVFSIWCNVYLLIPIFLFYISEFMMLWSEMIDTKDKTYL